MRATANLKYPILDHQVFLGELLKRLGGAYGASGAALILQGMISTTEAAYMWSFQSL